MDATRLSELVGQRLGMTALHARAAGQVAALRDIGLVSVPRIVLDKPGPLTRAERALLERHPLVGARIVRAIPGLEHLESWVRGGHERWDGRGYPDGLIGTEIPIEARIVSCCDAYDAMTTDSSYRAALPEDVARLEIQRGAGRQFDPDVAAALLDVLPEPRPDQASERRQDAARESSDTSFSLSRGRSNA